MDSSYTEFQQTLMAPIEAVFLGHAARIRERALEGMALQAKFIAVAGLGGSLLHASTPLSGYEHVISHLIDQQSEHSGRPPALHGTQVVLASMLVSEAYRLFLGSFDPAEVRIEGCYPTERDMKKRIETAFAAVDPSGNTAAECWKDYRIKLERWHSNRQIFEDFLKDWAEIRSGIERFLRTPEYIASILAELGSPLSFDELDPPVDEGKVKFAFLNAPLIRRRATLGDLIVFLGWDREALWETVWRRTKAVAEAARHRRDYTWSAR
jgi:glycerol-1-phosphate dehydrogenase [NAD(P)+]